MKEFIGEEKLQQFFNGELSPEEARAVVDRADLDEDNHKAMVEAQQAHFRVRWAYRDELIKGDYSTFKKRMARSKPSWRRYAAVAAVFLAAVVGGVLLTDRLNNDNPAISGIGVNDNHPILLLSDGSRHEIDQSSIPFEITEKNGVRLVLSGDEINYQIVEGDIHESDVEPVNHKLIVPRGAAPYLITLSDKTKVWLNSDSEMTYPLTFTGAERRVTIKGEAYFDVTENVEMPFIVQTGPQSIAVLGTEFNVSMYPDEDIVTTLVSGSVIVYFDGNGETTLIPGEQSGFDTRSGNIGVKNVDVDDFISWKNGMISVEGITFEQVLMKISRKFDVEFELTDDQLKNRVMKGSISADESFDTILSIMKKLVDVKFQTAKDGKIKVTKS